MGALILIVAIIGVGVWNIYFRATPIQPASLDKMAFPLPEKPSIAVLPFDNLSGDPEQDYIADGMTENIITALSYIPEIFVIARNSTFTYKGKAVKAQEVAEDLGVRYILEGSVQRAGDRVRITAQLNRRCQRASPLGGPLRSRPSRPFCPARRNHSENCARPSGEIIGRGANPADRQDYAKF